MPAEVTGLSPVWDDLDVNEWVGGPDWEHAVEEQWLLGELFVLVMASETLTQGQIDVALGIGDPPE